LLARFQPVLMFTGEFGLILAGISCVLTYTGRFWPI